MTVSSASVCLEENEVIRLVLQFLSSRTLHKSTRNLERETGITNCSYTEDVLFLRQLILDGEWDAILTFAQPLEKIEGFDVKRFRYLVLKEKFMEILYFKSGLEGTVSSSYSIDDMIKCLNQLEKDCPEKSDYTKLCWLLTVPDLYDQPEYRDWNPETARIKCFGEIVELLKNVIPLEKKNGYNKHPNSPAQNRLVTLIVKGLCFESCVDYCHQRAVKGELDRDDMSVSSDVMYGTLHESTGNFLSWLHSLPQESFATPFEPVPLKVDIKKSPRHKKFQLSSKRLQNEAENLSKSLSISARPSTAESVGARVADIPGLVAGAKKVSSSYSNFHYTQVSTSFRPIQPDINNDMNTGIQKKESQIEADSKGVYNGVSNGPAIDNWADTESPSEVPHVTENKAAMHGIETVIKPNGTQRGVHDSQDSLDRLKQNQENSVLKQLEEHERQQSELRRQLMENSNVHIASTEILPQEQAHEQQHLRHPSDDTCQSDGQKLGVGQEATSLHINRPNKSDRNDNSHNSSSRMQRGSPVGKEVSPCFKDNTETPIKPPMHVTSTPLAKKKSIPEPLKLDNVSISHIEGPSASESQLHRNLSHTNQSQTDGREPDSKPNVVGEFPKTPKANMLPPGHWVALADGSGVFNTSTPKSSRQKMTNTPGPSESPVDVANATGTNELKPQNLQDAITSDCGQAPDVNDKASPAVTSNETPNTRKGPKINGVRRTLVSTGPPMARNKVTATPTEEREAKTPRQDRPLSSAKNKSQGLNANSPRGRPSVNQKLGAMKSREQTENVKPKAAGNTFVVNNVSHDLPTKVENKNGDTKQGVTNLTYNKVSTKPPPSMSLSQQHRETLMSRQTEYMKSNTDGIRFCTVASLEDAQAIRAVTFHPSGDLFAIGSNSKTLRVCAATALNTYKKVDSNEELVTPQPTILLKLNRHHRGSIYCVAWNNTGDMIATGSNDKTIKVLRFDADNCTQIGMELNNSTQTEMELNIHSGTVRDIAFAPRTGGTTVLVSGGAGSGNIPITDCSTGNTIGQLKGHSGHIMSIFATKDDIIASGSNDNTVRLWDLRSQRCIDAIATGDSCVASVCLNAKGTLLASGHEDGGCMIYDITAGRTLQFFKPHTLDCRSVRFSPDGNYLLTASYDTSMILLDMQHNLECSIPPYSVVAQHRDKVIQCRWHPQLMAFVSSSADKRACLWTLDC